MKTIITFKRFFSRREGWILTLLVLAAMFASCYEFFTIDQPTEAYNNSSFEVSIVVKEDDGGNDWTVPDLQNIGLFGVLLPDGWSANDSIFFTIISDSSQYNNEGYLKYSSELSTMLEDSVGSPENYSWWGAKTTENADMSYFDSLYFTVTINTDEQVGNFSLQYSVGDEDYWDRNPSDDLSDPMPIEITQNPATSINVLNDSEFKVFPNPTTDFIYIEMDWSKFTNANLRAYDAAGKLIYSDRLSESNNSIDLTSYPAGTYIVSINSEFGSVSKKVLVK